MTEETTTLADCMRCGIAPHLNDKPTPMGMRLEMPLTEIRCPKCGMGVSAYGRAKATGLWQAANTP